MVSSSLLSLSARRAWIEISLLGLCLFGLCVALRKESVDRNIDAVQIVIVVVVALRKESVDRNFADDAHFVTVGKSLSARRAWIEIAILELMPLTAPGRSPQGERG